MEQKTKKKKKTRGRLRAPSQTKTSPFSPPPSPLQSGAYKVSGTMTAPVPAHVVWDVLTDFDNQVRV